MAAESTDSADSARSGQLFFGVDARHVRQLGRQLVGDRVTALVELVKNAYDADATQVLLSFSTNMDVAGGRIVVSDDGTGMSLDDIRTSWMRIAGDQKEVSPKSPLYGRTRAGRKGIGRFAAESLGRKLILWSTQVGKEEAVEVEFDWDIAYEAGLNLQDVANHYRLVPAAAEASGTKLTIEGLNDPWTSSQRARVARALLLLQPPFPVAAVARSGTGSVDPGFRVHFLVNGKPERSRSIAAFLDGETARIHAEVDLAGALTLSVFSPRLGIDRTETLEATFPAVGPLTLVAAYFVYASNALGVPTAEARALGAEYGGVRIYRDGLRLLPYGEPSNDWLGLDEKSRRREYLNPIGNQNFFAQVSIGRAENPLLEDTSSREGLLRNEAYEQLVEAVSEALIQASLWVASARNRVGRGTEKPKATPRPTRQTLLSDAFLAISKALYEQLPAAEASATEAIVAASLDMQRSTAAASDADETLTVAQLQNEVELLRVLASLGTSISVFSHEVRSVVNRANAELLKVPQSNDVDLSGAVESITDLRDIAKYIDSFTGGARSRERSVQALSEVLRSFVLNYARPLARGIQVDWDVQPASLRTEPMGQTALQAILINLITNSVKALDGEDIENRRILVSARPDDDGRFVHLDVSDTGGGIPEEIRGSIFDPFVTSRKASELDLGVGTGLGLKIVADLAEEHGGRAEIAPTADGFSTTLRVRIPRWREQLNAS